MILTKKHRHILAVALGVNIADMQNVNELLKGIAAFVGVEQYALADPYVEKVINGFNGNVFVMRCVRGYEGSMLTALSFIKQLNSTSTGICTIRISGTIKKLMEFALANSGAISELIHSK
ncbi:MAG: Rpp14/Pop5 family protein [Candidatus Micrarchaeaceae archaeon]